MTCAIRPSRLLAAAAPGILFAWLLLAVVPTRAQTPPGSCGPSPAGSTCGGAGVATIGDADGAPIGAGNPIHLATGNKTLTEVDLPPLPGPLGLEVVRHYNSVHAAPGVPPTAVGRGWRLSYDTELRAGPTQVQVLQADGSRLVFRRDAADPASCASDDPAHGRLAARRTRDGEAFDWHWPDGRVLAFDTRGRLVQIRLPGGDRKTLQRDAQGELVSVTDPQGRRLVVVPGPAVDGWRGIAAIETPTGRVVFRHGGATGADDAATLLAVERPHADGGSVERRYHHEDPRFPMLLTGVSVTGPDGHGGRQTLRASTYRYGADGRAVESMLGDATAPLQRVTVDRSRPGETRIVAADGSVTVARHAIVGGRWRLLSVTGPGCAGCPPSPMRFTHDALGRVVEETALDDLGRPLRSRTMRRDGQGRVVEVTVTDARTGESAVERRVFDGQAREPSRIERASVVEGRLHTLAFERDAAGQVVRVVESGFRPVDDQGRPLPAGLDGRVPAVHAARAVPLLRETRFRHADIGGRSRLVAIDGPLPNGPTGTPADSDVTRLHWDTRGDRIVRVESPGGRVATPTHDAAGRLVALRDGDGRTLRWRHDPRGAVIAEEDQAHDGAAWQVREVRVDALDRPVEQWQGLVDRDGTRTAEADAAQWRAGWDVAGRPLWRVTAAGEVRRWTWDEAGRLVAHAQSAGAQRTERRWRHDAAGRLLQEADAHGPLATLHRDAGGAVVATEDALGRATRVGITRGAPRLRVLHDDFGRAVARLSVDHGDRVDTHDAADRLVASRDARGAELRLAWDLRDRPVEQVLAMPGTAPEVTRWTWEGARLAAVDHPVQSERYRHDAAGRLVARTVSWPAADGTGAGTRVVQRWAYDARGRLTGWTLADGSWLRITRDGRGQVVALHRDRLSTPWLRWLLPAQPLATDLARDAVGPTRIVYGNGLASQRLRSADGALVRVWHGPAGERPVEPRGRTKALRWLPGIGTVHAAPQGLPAFAAAESDATDTGPGWLGRPAEAGLRLDERYLWDRVGNLVLRESRGESSTAEQRYLYDGRDQLLQATTVAATGDRSVERFAYDAAANRVLADAGADDGRLAPARLWPDAGSHRIERLAPAGGGAGTTVRHDAAGLPATSGRLRLGWDAAGRLATVHDADRTVAAYAFDHRGQRVRRTVEGLTVHDLHDDRRRSAEIAADGEVRRLWVWLGDLPIAVVDPTTAVDTPGQEGRLADLARDLRTLLRSWRGDGGERIAYLHSDHLGAPVLATGADGRTLWQARHAAFGRARIVSAADGFTLDLRLPGQHEDAVTGLHHNDHRPYDPDLGRYLSPDPLGAPDGPNPYVYVRNNPLKHVDPSGLVLFAFDGTGNAPDDRTNVRHFAEAYDDFSDFDLHRGYTGMSFYLSGPGTGMDGTADAVLGLSLERRIALQFGRFQVYLRENWQWHRDRSAGFAPGPLRITLDVVGFSRGAAMAREFSHRVGDFRRSDDFRAEFGTCLSVLQRLLALFDTVLSVNAAEQSLRPLRMAVPPDVAVALHAVAMNEMRAAFPLESIAAGASTLAADGGQAARPVPPRGGGEPQRLERGFVGAHSDIGGGYADGDLSDLALMWMVQRAREAGVAMNELAPAQRQVTRPVVHDERRSAEFRWTAQPFFGGRDVRFTTQPGTAEPRPVYGDFGPDAVSLPPGSDAGTRTAVDQRRLTWSQGMSQAEAARRVRTDGGVSWTDSANGRIDDLCAYLAWLRRHYQMTIPPHAGCAP